MIWLTGILCSLAGALIWALLWKASILYSSRRGELAGYFYQITHTGDPQRVMSIELARVRHSRRSETLSGTWWRIYPDNMSRRWEFDAWLLKGIIAGKYRNNRGNGLGGTFRFIYTNNDQLHGTFNAYELRQTPSNATIEDFWAPMEWRRLGESESDDEQIIVALLRTKSEKELFRYLPWSVRRQLRGRFKKTSVSATEHPSEELSVGNAVSDPNKPATPGAAIDSEISVLDNADDPKSVADESQTAEIVDDPDDQRTG